MESKIKNEIAAAKHQSDILLAHRKVSITGDIQEVTEYLTAMSEMISHIKEAYALIEHKMHREKGSTLKCLDEYEKR